MRVQNIIKVLLYLSVLHSSTSCAYNSLNIKEVTYHNARVESEFVPYLQEFEKYWGCPVSIKMKFEDLSRYKKSWVGVCYGFKSIDAFKSISIDLAYWKESNLPEKEELIFHELGHCVLDREHDEKQIPGGGFLSWESRPKSIMYPYTLFYDDYTFNRAEYLKELFYKKCK